MTTYSSTHSFPDYRERTLYAVVSQLNRDLELFNINLEKATMAAELFIEATDIRPIDCDHAASAIKNLLKPFKRIETATKEISEQSLSMISIRSRLLRDIYRADQYTSTLYILLNEFRSICFQRSCEKADQLSAIRENFILLIETSQNIKLQGEFMINQSLFGPDTMRSYNA